MRTASRAAPVRTRAEAIRGTIQRVSESDRRPNTTHDWAVLVDAAHLATIRSDPTAFAPTGLLHLILEVVAYAADEAASGEGGRCIVVLCADGSVSVADNGRGTDTRRDSDGAAIKKPVMSTKDLRFFDSPGAQTLPDGHPRRGMSVVAALSRWLVHTNRRTNGAWAQRYEHGVPVTGLQESADTTERGTTVHFAPDEELRVSASLSEDDLRRCSSAWPQLDVVIRRRAIGQAIAAPSSDALRLFELAADLAAGERRRMNVDVVVARVGGDLLQQGWADRGAGLHGPGSARAELERDHDRAGDMPGPHVNVRPDGGRGEVTRLEGVAELVAGDGVAEEPARSGVCPGRFLLVVQRDGGYTTPLGRRYAGSGDGERGGEDENS